MKKLQFLLGFVFTLPLFSQNVLADAPSPFSLHPQGLYFLAEAKTSTKSNPVLNHLSSGRLHALLLERLLVAEIAGQRGQLDLAVQNYVEAAQISQSAEIAERAARVAIYARDNNNALIAARLWLELDSSSLDAHQVLAALLVRKGRTDEALQHFEVVIADGDKDEHKGYLLITSLLSKEQDKQAALAVMEKLVAKRQKNIHALYAYAHLALLVGEYKKSEQAIEKAIKIEPDWAKAHILLVNILSRQGRDKESLQILQSVLDKNPDDYSLRLFYARKLVDVRRLKDARDEFLKLVDNPDQDASGDALYALGLISLQINEDKAATSYFKKLLGRGKRLNEANYYLGQLAEQEEQYKEAVQFYSSVRFGEHKVEANIRIAVLIAHEGKVEEARQRLHAIEAKSGDIELRLYLAEGEILRDNKQDIEAFDLYTEALAELPDNTELLYARALTAERIDRLDVAIQDLREIVLRQPANARALNALGFTLVDRTDNIDEGVSLIERAYKIDSKDAAILDSMGWAYYRQGRHSEALGYLHQAFKKNKDGEIAAHLGEVMWVSGNKAGARDVWDAALQETPSHKILLDVIKRFTE